MSIFIKIVVFLCFVGYTQQFEIIFQNHVSCKKNFNWCFYAIYLENLRSGPSRRKKTTKIRHLARHGFHCWNGPKDEDFSRKGMSTQTGQVEVMIVLRHNCTDDGRLKMYRTNEMLFSDGKPISIDLSTELDNSGFSDRSKTWESEHRVIYGNMDTA